MTSREPRARLLLRQCIPVLFATMMAGVVTPGCVRVKSDPVKVDPIEINVNVRIKVDRELDNFFNDIDAADPTQTP